MRSELAHDERPASGSGLESVTGRGAVTVQRLGEAEVS